MNIEPYEIKKKNIKVPYHIIAKSESPDSLVSFGPNSFFNGMYQAYADHRPFVLSPDMIWLLISQGFARHINANQESMRNELVDFSGKLSLIVREDKKLEDPTLSWEKIFPQFTEQISQYAGKHLTELLTCNFSTTTSLEKVASEITIMEAVKPYFEFIIIRIVCGIPEITLEGTPEDWEKLLHKARGLKEYKLDWWISELEPLLEEFVKASKGEVNKDFWRNMFKYHSQKRYGAPNIIDGWIVKFFPYDMEGKRNNLKQLEGKNCLPDEIAKQIAEFVVEGIAFLIALVAAWTIVHIIARMLRIVSRIPVLSGVNRTLGVFAGGIYGVILVWIGFYIVAVTSTSELGGMLVTYIYQSNLLKYLYENNAILTIVMNFL